MLLRRPELPRLRPTSHARSHWLVPWSRAAGILHHTRHLLCVGVKSIFFRAVESTLTLIQSAAALESSQRSAEPFKHIAPAVQRRSYRPFVNTTPRILLPTIKFNVC
ncbi:hypothetical protein VPH35_065784 [Triticum aestivum]